MGMLEETVSELRNHVAMMVGAMTVSSPRRVCALAAKVRELADDVATLLEDRTCGPRNDERVVLDPKTNEWDACVCELGVWSVMGKFPTLPKALRALDERRAVLESEVG